MELFGYFTDQRLPLARTERRPTVRLTRKSTISPKMG